MRGEWVRGSDGHCGSEGGMGEWMRGEWVRRSDGHCGSERDGGGGEWEVQTVFVWLTKVKIKETPPQCYNTLL